MGNELWISMGALTVSALGLVLSFYILSRNKAKLHIEKYTLHAKKEKNEVWLEYYLSNVGEKPTAIKEIDFYVPENRQLARTTSLQVFDETVLGAGEYLPTSKTSRYKAISFPFVLESNKTIKILSKLDFSVKYIYDRQIKRQNLKYVARIRYSNKIFHREI